MTEWIMLKFFLIFFLFILHCSCFSVTLDTARILLEKGEYQRAKEVLFSLRELDGDPAIQAELFKELGTVSHKLNEEPVVWETFFDRSIQLYSTMEDTPEDKLALVYFQKANCLLNTGFLRLRGRSLSGIEQNEVFDLLKTCVVPVRNCLLLAENSYPESLKADLYVVHADVIQMMQILTKEQIREQNLKILLSYYEKCCRHETTFNPKPRIDLLLYATLRQVTIYRQLDHYEKAIELSKMALKMVSSNQELNLEARLQYAASELKRPGLPKNFSDLENLLLSCINAFELLRKDNVIHTDFFRTGRFFAKRVAVYELLLELYWRAERFEDMLQTVGLMKARAFKELVQMGAEADAHLDLKSVQANLAAVDAGAVEYFLGPENSWLFYVDGTGLICRKLDCSGYEVVQRAQSMRKALTNRMLLRHYKSDESDPDCFQELHSGFMAAHQLYKTLLSPIMGLQQKHKLLYIVPHNVTNYLPFSALVKTLCSENLLNSEFFVEHGSVISYVPSLTLLENPKKIEREGRVNRIFSRSRFTAPFYNLPNCLSEASTIVKLLRGSQLFADDKFTEVELCRSMPVDILYLATHLNLSPESPENTGLILSADGEKQLTVKKMISHLQGKFQINLTILSVCQTNLGRTVPVPGDDLATLSRAFLIAGSKAVVSSQWEVTDKQTPMILQQLVLAYKDRKSPAESLHNALNNYLDQISSPIYRHPFFWANLLVMERGFTLW